MLAKQLLRRLNGQLRFYSAPSERAIPPSKQRFVAWRGDYPRGFRAGTAHVGVKPSNTCFDDLTIIASDVPCSAAAVFTKNRFQAAPVVVSRETLKRSGGEGVRAVVVNSGCANAVTGQHGITDAVRMAEELNRCLEDGRDAKDSTPSDSTIVMSTGVIGQRLPIQNILFGIPNAHTALGSSHDHWLRAARAICTTDTFPKLRSRQFTLPSSPDIEYRLAGITKGAGMIHPNMATLLGIICTDAPVAAPALHPLLTAAVAGSFNAITIDGDTSTNDTVALLANGAGGGSTIGDSGPDHDAFRDTLSSFAAELARLVVRDGEGATKFITVRVVGALTDAGAKAVASAIATSPLVKTALYGRDANWGRVLCAAGYAPGVGDGEVVPEETSVTFVVPVADDSGGWKKNKIDEKKIRMLVMGEPKAVDESRAAKLLENEDLEIRVRVGEGVTRTGQATVWTCDLSHEYVTINGEYRT